MTAPVPRLAVRQELFCEEIAAGASAAEAARRAGYSPHGVRQRGHFLHDLSGDSGSDPAPAVTDSDLAGGSGSDVVVLHSVFDRFAVGRPRPKADADSVAGALTQGVGVRPDGRRPTYATLLRSTHQNHCAGPLAPAMTDSDLSAVSGDDPAPAVADSDPSAVSGGDPAPAVTDSDLSAVPGNDPTPAVTDSDLAAIPGSDPIRRPHGVYSPRLLEHPHGMD